MRNKVSVGEYLAFLSIKYEIDPDRLFYALISAWKNQKSTCEKLSVTCRKKTHDTAVFLLTRGSKVIAQFPIPKNFLLEKNNPIRNFRKTDLLRRYSTKKAERKPHPLHIGDLETGMKQINLRVKVLEIPKPKLVFTRFGNYATVANVLIADETGTIRLCLWNEQISSISEGDIIQIKNAHAYAFRGEQQLRIGKNGKLSVIEDAEFPSVSLVEKTRNLLIRT
jgi:replication factor A1